MDKIAVARGALEVLDDGGLDSFNTRKVAMHLGIKQPALYWHFANRAELLAAMVDVLLQDAGGHSTPAPEEPWQDFLARSAYAFRRALLASRDGGRLFAGTTVIANKLSNFEHQLRYLQDAGFELRDAVAVTISIGNYVLGCVIAQQSQELRQTPTPTLQELKNHPVLQDAFANFAAAEDVFVFGLKALIAGFEGNT